MSYGGTPCICIILEHVSCIAWLALVLMTFIGPWQKLFAGLEALRGIGKSRGLVTDPVRHRTPPEYWRARQTWHSACGCHVMTSTCVAQTCVADAEQQGRQRQGSRRRARAMGRNTSSASETGPQGRQPARDPSLWS